jgi:hypothetical protein
MIAQLDLTQRRNRFALPRTQLRSQGAETAPARYGLRVPQAEKRRAMGAAGRSELP